MSKNKSEAECPVELESQFILRLPEEPAKKLRELLKTNGSLKNRLTIQIDNDMRHGEVRFDDWVLHAKIVDLPTIIESLKTIDTKSFYKTADICQLMICKEEPDQPTVTEDDTSGKLKKKDPYKVDKKFLWLHGITPPTKNVRKRRFRKTLRKKCVEAPEIEKEVKRLLRADNEAESITYEVIQEDSDPVKKSEIKPPIKPEKKGKSGRKSKKEPVTNTTKPESSNVVDIFGGAVSDSDMEDDNPNNERETGDQYPVYDSRLLENSSPLATNDVHGNKDSLPSGFKSKVQQYRNKKKASQSRYDPSCSSTPSTSGTLQYGGISSGDENDYQTRDRPKENMTSRIEQLKAEVDELKQRRQRTQHEISGIENLSLQQRFAEILHTLNQDIMYKEMEYQGLLTLQNSDII